MSFAWGAELAASGVRREIVSIRDMEELARAVFRIWTPWIYGQNRTPASALRDLVEGNALLLTTIPVHPTKATEAIMLAWNRDVLTNFGR